MTPSGQHFEILAASFAGIGQTAIEITISPSEVQHSPKQARIATSSSITIPSSIATWGPFWKQRVCRHGKGASSRRGQNGIAERWVGGCRREMLDHVIALNKQHLRRLLREYIWYFQEDHS